MGTGSFEREHELLSRFSVTQILCVHLNQSFVSLMVLYAVYYCDLFHSSFNVLQYSLQHMYFIVPFFTITLLFPFLAQHTVVSSVMCPKAAVAILNV